MTERKTESPYQQVSPEELQLPTHELMRLLDAALHGEGPDGKSISQQYVVEPEAEKARATAEVAAAETKAQAEKERHIHDLENACLAMVDRAIALLHARHLLELEFKNPGSNTQPQTNSYFRMIKGTGGDLPSVRFIFNLHGQSYDIILTKHKQRRIEYEQRSSTEMKWRRAPLHEGEVSAGVKFYGEDLLLLEQELAAVAEALELTEDFVTPITPTHE